MPESAGADPQAMANARKLRMLRTAMGPAVVAALADPNVVELLLNPDGALWVDRLGEGRTRAGVTFSPQDAERIIRLVAEHLGTEVHRDAPVVSAELPETGERFQGLLPPITRAPAFVIRKHAAVTPLAEHVADGVMTPAQANLLRTAVFDRKNILIAGGTSTGKTMLANALLQVVAETGDRVVLIEDTLELECKAADHLPLRTMSGGLTLTDLVRITMRLTPDRIVIGEVRGGEALGLVKAWGKGHPGGVATIHAGSAAGALTQLEQLILEAAVTVPRELIAQAVNVIVYLEGRGHARRVKEIVRVDGLDESGYRCVPGG